MPRIYEAMTQSARRAALRGSVHRSRGGAARRRQNDGGLRSDDAPRTEVALRAIGTALAGALDRLRRSTCSPMAGAGCASTAWNIWHLRPAARVRATSAGASLTRQRRSTWRRRVAGDRRRGRAADAAPVEIVAARADRVWLRIDGAIRSAPPGDDVPARRPCRRDRSARRRLGAARRQGRNAAHRSRNGRTAPRCSPAS